MRILHVVPTYLPAYRYGGPIVSIHALARALVKEGHDVEVFTTNVDGPGTLAVPVGRPVDVHGVPVTYFPSGRPRRLYRSPQLGRALRDRVASFDVVHLHSLFLWPTLAAARAAHRAGVPYVVSPRGMLVRDLVRRRGRLRKLAWLNLFERRTLEGAAVLHATSKLEAEEAQRFGYRLPPIEVIPNGVQVPLGKLDEERVKREIRGLRKRAPLVLYLGRVSWKKGLSPLIEAVQDVPGATLVLAGPDDEGLWAKLRDRARDLGCLRRILYVGEVHGASKRFLLEHAEVLVLPSYGENFGNVILEALAHGTPVLCSPEVGAAEIVEQHDVGRVVPPEPAALAEALNNQLYLEQADRDQMNANARALAEGEYAWPTIAGKMAACYRGLRRESRLAG